MIILKFNQEPKCFFLKVMNLLSPVFQIQVDGHPICIIQWFNNKFSKTRFVVMSKTSKIKIPFGILVTFYYWLIWNVKIMIILRKREREINNLMKKKFTATDCLISSRKRFKCNEKVSLNQLHLHLSFS